MRSDDAHGEPGTAVRSEKGWSRRELWARLWRPRVPPELSDERPVGAVTGRPLRLRLERLRTATDGEEGR